MLGWTMTPFNATASASVDWPILCHPDELLSPFWQERQFCASPGLRAMTLLLGINDPAQRSECLQLGFGDVLHGDSRLNEIALRAERVDQAITSLPRIRQFGRLRLDLLARDGFVDGNRLGLHPREFALIWRLADTPGIPVAKETLVIDVWRLAFVPDTNSLAVHISRLRTKLAIAGLDGMVQTAASGGYLLVPTHGIVFSVRSHLPEDDLLDSRPPPADNLRPAVFSWSSNHETSNSGQ